MTYRFGENAEWLEADGLGGFASGTVCGRRTRRYHALLLTATTPPTGRMVLVNGYDAWAETPAGRFALSSQRYQPGVDSPDGNRRLETFEPDPWPRWSYRLEDGTRVECELFIPHERRIAALCWRLLEGGAATLIVRPFLSGRDYHALHHENALFRFDAEVESERVRWQPYPGVPAIQALSNGEYAHQPAWNRNFLYEEERARGLDAVEDLASPGTFRFDLARGEAVWVLTTEASPTDGEPIEDCLRRWREAEQRRRAPSRQENGPVPLKIEEQSPFPGMRGRLHRAADAYLVRRGGGKTIVAGYPWFTDWGRDTFIALRGLCLATGRLDDAGAILLAWAETVSEGLLPNRFPDRGDQPEFNAVDASLWYVLAVHEFLQVMEASGRSVPPDARSALTSASDAILTGYERGTRFGIRLDDDGLIAAGVPGVQLTWMDAKVGDRVVTPRIGKPVEIQALWLNALRCAERSSSRWSYLLEKGSRSFVSRFWNETSGYLHDVVDLNYQPGTVDATLRPNQIFAAGGLPFCPLDREKARRVVDAVEAVLWTPLGLRTLAPGSPGYAPRYQGGPRERDEAYHEGTVWPWLAGPFVEAWVRVRGGTAEAKREARTRFLDPLLSHLDDAGIGHLPEVADGDPPHKPGGCPFQAWSVGEALRLTEVVLAEDSGNRVRSDH
jgi:predicted glycogen debranching enzyme